MHIWHGTPDARTPRRVPTQTVELTVGTWPTDPGQSVWIAWAAIGAKGNQADGVVAAQWQHNTDVNSYWTAHLGPFADGAGDRGLRRTFRQRSGGYVACGGCVSIAAVEMMWRDGITWLATDAGMLARSGQWGNRTSEPDVLCQPYRASDDAIPAALFCRVAMVVLRDLQGAPAALSERGTGPEGGGSHPALEGMRLPVLQ